VLKVKVFAIRKNKHCWINEGIKEYEKRLRPTLHFDWYFFKNTLQLMQAIEKEKFFICLHTEGKELDSTCFSTTLFQWFEKFQSKVTFIIGDADGLPSNLTRRAHMNLCLSKLTFTHQMSRLILTEQIYRAYQIHINSKYQK